MRTVFAQEDGEMVGISRWLSASPITASAISGARIYTAKVYFHPPILYEYM